jgi:PAS domain S-box-containing protein
LGYAPNKLKGDLDTFKKILHPEDNKRTFAVINKCFKEKQPYKIEYRLKTKTGTYCWFLATGVTKYDNAKKPIRMVGSIIDINNRKATESDLKEKIEELTKINNIMAGREVKMTELKETIATLKKSKT